MGALDLEGRTTTEYQVWLTTPQLGPLYAMHLHLFTAADAQRLADSYNSTEGARHGRDEAAVVVKVTTTYTIEGA